MSGEREPRIELPEEDRALLQAVDRVLRPAPMTAQRAARFQREVRSRIEVRPPGWFRWLPPLLASAAAGLALWALFPQEPESPAEESAADELAAEESAVEKSAAEESAAEELVTLLYPASDSASRDSAAWTAELNDHLPVDYQRISDLLESGDGGR